MLITQHRFDCLTGDSELIPVHAMPSTIIGADDDNDRQLQNHTHSRRLKLGFNVDDAATHIKLDSREDSASASIGAAGQQRSGGGSGKGRRPAAAVGKPSPPRLYDPAAWSPQQPGSGSGGGALPSLIIRR